MDAIDEAMNSFGLSQDQSTTPTTATSDAIGDAMDSFGINVPKNVQSAKSDLGSQLFNGYCQTFVEQKTYGQTGIYPTAVDAWNQQINRARPGLDGARPGDLVYFAPDSSNGNDGHVGIYEGNNKFISATYNGVREENINDWMKSTGQRLLGHISGNVDQ